MVALSYSRLKMFRDCPRKFYHMSVAPKGSEDYLSDFQGKQGREGSKLHRVFEMRIKHNRALDPEFANFEPILKPIADGAAGAEITVEQPWAWTAELEECDWFSKQAWFRVKCDLTVIHPERARMCDWKSGKVYVDTFQLKINSAFLMLRRPTVQTVDAELYWLNHDDITRETYFREEVPEIFDEILAEAAKIEKNKVLSYWPEKPGNLCAWCPVNAAGRCDRAAKPFKRN